MAWNIRGISRRADQLATRDGTAIPAHADKIQARGLRGFLAFPHCRGLDLTAERDKSTFRVNDFIGLHPETGRDMLTASLHVRDSAAAVADQHPKLRLAAPGGTTVLR